MNREVCGICWCPYENGACGCKPQTGASMTTDELIDTGHKAGTLFITQFGVASVTTEWLENFAALVAAAEREAIIQSIPGGHSVDPQWVCDMIRSRNNP